MTANRFEKDDGRKFYHWKGDEDYQSVTSILNSLPTAYPLMRWGDTQIANFAIQRYDDWKNLSEKEAIDLIIGARYRTMDAAAARGTHLHDFAEKTNLGQAIEIEQLEPEVQPFARGFLKFLADFSPKVEASEMTIYNRAHGWAGTCDTLAYLSDMPEALTLIDYKTVINRQKAQNIYDKHVLQTNAYCGGEFIGLPDQMTEIPMPKVDRGMILFVFPEGYRAVGIDINERAYRQFRYVQQIANFKAKEFVQGTIKPPKL